MTDIVIIGGGIHGAGAAQAAAAAGYAVRVFEQSPAIAQGTSSRSSKLIHGGLRYLATGQFALVRECLRERQLLLDNAPSLVRLVPFYIPVYKTSAHNAFSIAAGLSLYALLGKLQKAARFHYVPSSKWDELDGLKTHDLRSVFQYFDAQTDDRRLTEAVMRSAISLGAELVTRCEVVGIELRESGVEIRFRRNNAIENCAATVVINATGPWVNQLLDRVQPPPPRQAVDLVQGTHIIVPGKLTKGIYYVEAPQDRRAVFIIPWQGNTMVGTTETLYAGDPAQVRPTQTEIDYLLETLAYYFPGRACGPQAIVRSFAGLRCLPANSGSLSARPRETLLLTDRPTRPRLVTIYGGKLTAYRATAEKLIETIRPSLPGRQTVCDIKTLELTDPEEQAI